MVWEKLGRVYVPDGSSDWAVSHAYLPTAFMLDEETIRVYVAFLGRGRVGRVGFVDVAAADPRRVLAVSRMPALDIGEPGAFDDNGVSPTSVVASGGTLRLYYMGWQLGVRVPYLLFAGLAVSEDGGATFTRYSRTPVLDRAEGEHACRSAPTVLPTEGGWRMWYVGGSRWIDIGGKHVPTYNIRHAESADGISWSSPGIVVLDLADDDEYGLGRPFVRGSPGDYQMWYSIRSRSKGYRLGYATSPDGLVWTRNDGSVGIDVSESGWDSEMICFACVQETKYGVYMFYNGNNHGETGFGAAVLTDDV